jgi:uncharacterized protein (UPF0548 family)
MLSLRKPSAERLREFLAAQSKLDLTYSTVGATAAVAPAGYVVDHTRIKLGEGEKVFAAAKAALERWDHFRLGWVETCPPDIPIKVGKVVAVLARNLGVWWLNACRIVYVVDDDGPVQRFGFAYGTLPGHAEVGRNDSWPNGTGPPARSVTTFWHSHGHDISLPGSATRGPAGCRSGSHGTRRRRC